MDNPSSIVVQAETQPIIMAESLSIDDLLDVLDATIDVGHLWFKMGLALKLRDPVLILQQKIMMILTSAIVRS